MGIYEDTLMKVVEHMLAQKSIEVQDESVKRWMARKMGDKLSELGTMTSNWASHAGRSQPGYFDVERTFKSMNITAEDLAAEVKANAGKPMPKIDFPEPETRVHHTPAQPLLGTTSAKEMAKHPNVPRFLPPFPGPHTYKSTPMVPNNKTDHVEAREKMALKRRQEKDNLNHLYMRMKPTVSLFSEPTGRFDLLALEPRKRPAYMDALMPRDQKYEIDIYGDIDAIPEQAPKNPFLLPPKPPGTPKTPFPIDLGLIYNEYKGTKSAGAHGKGNKSRKVHKQFAPKECTHVDFVALYNETYGVQEPFNKILKVRKTDFNIGKGPQMIHTVETTGMITESTDSPKTSESAEAITDPWNFATETTIVAEVQNSEEIVVARNENTNIKEQKPEAAVEQASTAGSGEKVHKRSKKKNKKNKKQKKAKELKADLLGRVTSEAIVDLKNLAPKPLPKVEETQEKEKIAEQKPQAEVEQASTAGSGENLPQSSHGKKRRSKKDKKRDKKAKKSKADLLGRVTSEDLKNLAPKPLPKVEETQEKANIAEQKPQAEVELAFTSGSGENLPQSSHSKERRSKKDKKRDKKAKKSRAEMFGRATSEAIVDLKNLAPKPLPKVEETQEKANIAEQKPQAEVEQASTAGSGENLPQSSHSKKRRSKKDKKRDKNAKKSRADLLGRATSEAIVDLKNLAPKPVPKVEETQEKANIAEQKPQAEVELAFTSGSGENLPQSSHSKERRSKKDKKRDKKAKKSRAEMFGRATSEDLKNLAPKPVPKVEETQEKANIAEQKPQAEVEQASTAGSGENLPQSSHSKKRRFKMDKKRDKKAKKSRADLLGRVTSEASKEVENKENVPISVNKTLRDGKKSKKNA
ncbi:glutamic acid-rich protein [Drosophila madeirensis]|uniref:Transcription initiation factor TFIID subunit 8 n=1 Tax=Drosophila madeirensis TaxID=30013 RepID=A0AAU9FUR4_DROMD